MGPLACSAPISELLADRGRVEVLAVDLAVWSYRGDTIVRMVVYEEQAEALAAVGLGEA